MAKVTNITDLQKEAPVNKGSNVSQEHVAAKASETRMIELIGRTEFGLSTRSMANEFVSMRVQSYMGRYNISIHESYDEMDRDGVVFRIFADEEAGCFYPYAIETINGVELHIAGHDESQSIVKALCLVMKEWLEHRASEVSAGVRGKHG